MNTHYEPICSRCALKAHDSKQDSQFAFVHMLSISKQCLLQKKKKMDGKLPVIMFTSLKSNKDICISVVKQDGGVIFENYRARAKVGNVTDGK